MTSSAGACGGDVNQHLSSDHELHLTSIPSDVGDVMRHSTSGLVAHDTTEDMPVTDMSGQSLPRRNDINDGRMDASADNQDVTEGRGPASTLDHDATRLQNDKDDGAAVTTSLQRSSNFSSSETLTSSSAAVYPSYMHLRSKTSR